MAHANDEEDDDEMKNNDIYEGETEVEDYHMPYDDDNHEDNDEQHHL